MPRGADISNVEKSFILQALGQNIRLDGRAVDQYRNIELVFGDQLGAVTVSVGKTR